VAQPARAGSTHVHAKWLGHEVGMPGTHRAVHEAEDDLRLACRFTVQMPPELARGVLFEFGDGLVRHFDLQMEVVIQLDFIPFVVHEVHVDVRRFLSDNAFQFSGPGAQFPVVRRDGATTHHQDYALNLFTMFFFFRFGGALACGESEDARGQQSQRQVRSRM